MSIFKVGDLVTIPRALARGVFQVMGIKTRHSGRTYAKLVPVNGPAWDTSHVLVSNVSHELCRVAIEHTGMTGGAS